LIRLSNVSSRRGAFALQSINLEIGDGEYFVLLGPTGAGKTQLLEVIAGVQQAASGEIWIDGENVTSLPPEARHVGFMYQDYLLFPQLSVRRNIAFGLRRMPRAEANARVEEIARLLEIEPLLGRRVLGLSGGEQQRIALARALAPRPRVLLLDEPLSALDPQIRRELRRKLRSLHEELRMTTLHVTHDFEEALALAGRVGVIHEGVIVQTGMPDEVFRKPGSAFLASFLGVENLLRGNVVRRHPEEPRSGESPDSEFDADFDAGPLKLYVIAQREGPAYAAIRPEDITVSREPISSSARNTLEGTLAKIERSWPLVRLTFDVGMPIRVPLVAVITEQSLHSLDLTLGARAFLTIKATAIHLI
jgi:molybdate/tungstate transport system ATP-binding protein